MDYNVNNIASLRHYAKGGEDLQFYYRPQTVKVDFFSKETRYDIFAYGLPEELGGPGEQLLLTVDNRDALKKLLDVLRQGETPVAIRSRHSTLGEGSDYLSLEVVNESPGVIDIGEYSMTAADQAEKEERFEQLRHFCKVQNWVLTDEPYRREYTMKKTTHGGSTWDAVFTADHSFLAEYNPYNDGFAAASELLKHLRKPTGEYFTMPIWNVRHRLALFRRGHENTPLPSIPTNRAEKILAILNHPTVVRFQESSAG